MKVREASQLDFDNIYLLLQKLNNTSFSKSHWKKITTVNFNATYQHYGFVLEENDEILGFIGTIFSKREIKKNEVFFCNIHSWVVNPKVKTGGLDLLLRVLSLKDYVITNFTASEGPYRIFKSLKFSEINYSNFKLFPFQGRRKPLNVQIIRVNESNAELLLEQHELRYYNDHKQFNNVQFLYLQKHNEKSFVITKKKSYTPGLLHKIPFLKAVLKNKFYLAEIHYISNSSLFFSCFSNTITALKISRKLGAVGLIVANRYLPNFVNLKKKVYPQKRPYVYRNANDEFNIDTLYSEFFILDF